MDWLFGRLRRGTGTDTGERSAVTTRPITDREYIFGEGDAEISRLEMQHYLFQREFRSDYSAPLATPMAILDVACGTGRWVRDMARRIPEARVVGFDLNQEQLERSLEESRVRGDIPPPNCSFLQANALQAFPFADNSFDFVMARATSAFIPASQWPAVVREMARVCRPGGWVELRDFGLVQSKNEALNELTVRFARMASARGIFPGSGAYLADFLRGAGLQRVASRQVIVRSGSQQPTRGGRLMLADYLALLERVAPLAAQAGVDPHGDWTQLLQQARYETSLNPTEHYAEVELTAAFGQR